MHTLVSKLVALSVEKHYMALTEIQFKICRFHGSLSHKGSQPLPYSINVSLRPSTHRPTKKSIPQTF